MAEKKEKRSMEDFEAALRGVKVPPLILDQKWHQLFSDSEKPVQIQRLEEQLQGQLLRQSHLQQEIKDLKKLKNTLMDNIMENMEGAEGRSRKQEKKLAADRRLIADINGKLADYEEELTNLPGLMKETNEGLMLMGMEYCYDRLQENSKNIKETGEWIKNMRIELKKQVIRKQNAERTNRQIYTYMHDLFGPKVIDIFDLKYQQFREAPEETE